MAQLIWVIGQHAQTCRQSKKRKQTEDIPTLDEDYATTVE